MCGIAGIVKMNGDRVEESLIQQVTEKVLHRGPDSHGIFCERNIALGHRRLSIIDLTASGNQPMKFADKYVIVFNGEIYNYIEIKKELESSGYSFKTHSDTEVILAAYDKWKEQCVSKFNGMWAFAIYDRIKNCLFCSRDRVGVKPFYYTTVNNQFVFGSEIKQLLHLFENVKANESILLDYIVLGFEDHSHETFFKHISKVLPGHNLIFDLNINQFRIERYYSIRIDTNLSKMGETEAVDYYRKEFERSIEYRLRSDVKVGTCLSGGLDSSSIAALSSIKYSSQSKSKFTAITALSEDEINDEYSYAKQVAESSDLDWNVIKPSASDFLNSLNEIIYTQEEPFGSPSIFMQYFVMKKSKEIGCTVLLDGQGGDETLLGYERYYPAHLLSLPVTQKISGFLKISENSKLSRKELLKSYFYFTNAKLRINRQRIRCSFIKDKYLSLIDTSLVKELCESYSDIQALQLIELTKTQLPHLLRYEDKNSMRHSIETRLPFLDYKLVELSLSINNNLKIRNGYTKYILRKSIQDKVPKSIAWRKNKFGFESPPSWLSNEDLFNKPIQNSGIIRQICNRIPWVKNDIKLLWKLFNVAKWEEIYGVTID